MKQPSDVRAIHMTACCAKTLYRREKVGCDMVNRTGSTVPQNKIREKEQLKVSTVMFSVLFQGSRLDYFF